MLKITADNRDGSALKTEVDAAVDKFEAWFGTELKNGPLSGPEKSILSTFLWFMTRPERANETE